MLRFAEGLALPSDAALVFLLCTLPICLWVALTDLRRMRIRNAAVLALAAVFLVMGALVLPFDTYLRQIVQGLAMLAICFVMYLGRAMGGGDAKFIAAAAPFVAEGDAVAVVYLTATISLAALVTHRAVRRSPRLRALAPGWVSWDARKFPLGFALGPSLATYLALAAL